MGLGLGLGLGLGVGLEGMSCTTSSIEMTMSDTRAASTGGMVGVSHSPSSPVSTTERVGNISETTGSRQLRETKRDSSQLDGSTALWIDGGT